VSPFDILGLHEDASEQEIELRWRELRSKLHPDHGGDADEFHQAQQAYTEAIAEARRPKACSDCGGRGRKVVSRGFSQISLGCPTCGGSGEAR
jgi:DnaJ-class molecular chaperone